MDAAPHVAYRTDLGVMIVGAAEKALMAAPAAEYRGRVNLVLTSPPFPLRRRKAYGNRTGADYISWFASFGEQLRDMLADDGSIVVEMGNVWNPGLPTMSTVPLQALMAFAEAAQLHICQQFIAHNPARLPGPAQWVTVNRWRCKDAYTHIWWFAASPHPKANNRRVLVPYSTHMRKLLKAGTPNSGRRPSGHRVSPNGFRTDNGGAIPSNVLTVSNTRSIDDYSAYCKTSGLPVHPARMAPQIVEFFVRYLTEEGDIVLDPFAGSGTTGAVAERLKRRWLAIEADEDYAAGSIGRFSELIA